MAENVDNLILEQLRLIRADIVAIKSDLEKVKTGQQGVQVAGYMRDIGQPVEDLEGKFGGTA